MLLRLHPDVAATDTDDGTVLLHMKTGGYWQLNTTGSTVLRQLLDGHDVDRIAADLATRHGIDRNKTTHDVTVIVDQLCTAKLVITS